jgi:anti-anti-sigma factor
MRDRGHGTVQPRVPEGGRKEPDVQPLPQPKNVAHRIENTGIATIVHVTEEIDISNASTLGDVLFGTLARGRPLVVDLSHLKYIDSVGLHILLRAAQCAERTRLGVVLVAAGQVRKLMDSAGLPRLVRVVPDMSMALQILTRQSRPTPADGNTGA